MKKILIGFILSLVALSAVAQTSPNLVYGQVPTAGQWNSFFASKMDYTAIPPCSGSSNALTWASGSGFGCNTIASGSLNIPATLTAALNSDTITLNLPVPSGGGYPDAGSTYKADMVWNGGETKFGNWRLYHNAEEWGWGLTYNGAVNNHTVYPPAWAASDVYNTTASIGADMRFDVAEGTSGFNFYGIEFYPTVTAAATSVTAAGDSRDLYFYDSGALSIANTNSESLIQLNSFNHYGTGAATIGVNANGAFEIRNATSNPNPSAAASASASFSGTTMTVVTMLTGRFSVGQYLSGPGITAGTKITAFGTGTGSTGTYTTNNSLSLSAELVSGSYGPLLMSIDSSGNMIVAGTITSGSGAPYQEVSISNAGAVTWPAGVPILALTAPATVTGYTVTMPASPSDGQVLNLISWNPVDSLTISPNTGQTFGVTLTGLTLTPGAGFRFMYVASSAAWYRM